MCLEFLGAPGPKVNGAHVALGTNWQTVKYVFGEPASCQSVPDRQKMAIFSIRRRGNTCAMRLLL